MVGVNNIRQPDSSGITNPSANEGVALSVRIELDRRLAEDDASPNDSINWESIKTEAQKRWRNVRVSFAINSGTNWAS